MKWKLSFKTKMLLMLAGVSVTSLVLLAIEAYQSAVALRHGKEAVLKNASEGLMDKIDRNLFERYGDVQAFALSESARSGDRNRIQEFMNDMMVTYAPIYDLMIVTDNQGKVIAVTTKDKNGKDLSTQSLLATDYSKKKWFKQATSEKLAKGTSVVEDLHIDEDVARLVGNDGRVMNFSAPITDKKTGQVLGVWTNRMSWSDVVEAITKEEAEKIRNSQTMMSIAYIVNNKGIYLLHPEGADYELRKYHDRTIEKSLEKNKSKPDELTVREVEVSTPEFSGEALEARAKSKGYSTYPGRGWSTILQIPAQDQQTQSNRQLIILAFLLISIVNGIAFFFLRNLSGLFENAVSRMTTESSQVKAVATQISVASQQLSESTTEQAAALEETAASMEQISAMLSHTTQNAAQCKTLSEEGQADAQKGKQVISKMSAAMEDIASANTKLDRLVTVIDDIGNKTKIINDIVSETRLLSFNASIEAARAGVHGKGFAVVAEEVGKLASISGRAADEIRLLLESSVKEVSEVVRETQDRVSQGKNISQECEVTFSNMGTSLERVNDLIRTIAVASKDQETGIKQVTRAIAEMDKVTQSNSHNAEVLSDQASGLHKGAESLYTSIDVIQDIVAGDSIKNAGLESVGFGAKKKHSLPTILDPQKSPEQLPSRSDNRWKKAA